MGLSQLDSSFCASRSKDPEPIRFASKVHRQMPDAASADMYLWVSEEFAKSGSSQT
ncbi:hypothetical protein TWF132_005926, partial [Orbilia oligospora]